MLSKEWLLGLIGFGQRKAPPIVIAALRAGLGAGIAAAAGVITTSLNALDWGEYAPVGVAVMAGWRMFAEGVLDQKKSS